MTALSGKKIAFLTSQIGVEKAELEAPWQAVLDTGGSWGDETVFHCEAEGWDLITSRNPDDLPAFSSALTDVFAKA